MVRIRRLALAVLVVAAGLVAGSPVGAGPLKDFFCPCDCPPPDYSPLHYWTPGLVRLHDAHGPKLGVYAPDRHPEIPPTYTILKFPCPAVDPAATLIEPPTPPATSRFKY